jgi:hypothetical protein
VTGDTASRVRQAARWDAGWQIGQLPALSAFLCVYVLRNGRVMVLGNALERWEAKHLARRAGKTMVFSLPTL